MSGPSTGWTLVLIERAMSTGQGALGRITVDQGPPPILVKALDCSRLLALSPFSGKGVCCCQLMFSDQGVGNWISVIENLTLLAASEFLLGCIGQ